MFYVSYDIFENAFKMLTVDIYASLSRQTI